MKLNVNTVGLTTGIVAGIASIVCAILFWIAPAFTLNLFGSLFHGIDLSKITTTLSFGRFSLGLIVSVILGYLVGALFAFVYNKIAK